MRLSHWFIPHRDTHKKAHLLSIPALLAYIALFVILQMSISLVQIINPDVLGISTSVSQQELIRLTNVEREKNGLPAVKEDNRLNKAAEEKGKNMFAEDYWAHYSPSGKDPWGFIQDSGYKFTYAGENLARNFNTSEEVVNAWIASPTHKANILNSHYENIGIAVLEGTLKGQKTILIVQEFGTPVDYLVQADVSEESSPSGQGVIVVATSPRPDLLVSGVKGTSGSEKLEILKPDPYIIIKTAGLTILFFVVFLILLDLYIIRRRAVHRLSSRHVPSASLLAATAVSVVTMSRGSIL